LLKGLGNGAFLVFSSPEFCSQSEGEGESDVEIIHPAPGFVRRVRKSVRAMLKLFKLAPGFVRRVRERVRAMLKLFKLAPGFNLEYNENN
jgi:hypothetical protein